MISEEEVFEQLKEYLVKRKKFQESDREYQIK